MQRSALFLAGACLFAVPMAKADVPAVSDSATELRVSTEAARAALVIFPGAYLKASQYAGLAQAVVAQSKGEVAVFVPHFYGDFANPLEATDRVNEAIAFLEQHGVSNASSHVFVGGHSQGGIGANDLPGALNLGGLVLLGSYLPHTALIGKSLSEYPYPTLTLGGELDGLTGLNYLAREAQAVQTLAQSDQAAAAKKPVVVLPGVSHMQFADGATLAGDSILPEVTLDAAHQAMAATIVDFMATQTELATRSSSAAKAALAKQIATTNGIVQPYAAAAATQDSRCAAAQQAAATFADTAAWSKVRIDTQIYHHGPEDLGFILDKASVAKADDGYVLHLPVQIDEEIDLADISQDHFLSPRSLRCKMRSTDKLVEETGFAAVAATATTAPNCAALNATVIKDALKLLTPAQTERLAARFGTPATWPLSAYNGQEVNSVQYGPFQIRSTKQATGQDWVVGDFSLDRTAGSAWTVNTVELLTPKDFAVPAFAGANYCKLIAPTRVVEWATVFGLK